MRSDVPRQQVADAVDRVIRDARNDETQISLGIKPVESGRADQAVECRGPFAAGIRSGEQEVLSPQRHGAQCPFSGVVVDLDPSIRNVADQRLPMIQGIADGVCQSGFLRELSSGSEQPDMKCIEDRFRPRPSLLADIRGFATQFGLDGIQGSDALQCLGGDGRTLRLMNLEELAPSMGPTGGFNNVTPGVQGIKAGKGIRLENPLKGFQVALGMFALAIR